MSTIDTLPRDCSVEDVTERLRTTGACIVEGRLEPATLSRFMAEVQPLIDRTGDGRDDFVGTRTRRTGALIGVSETCREVAQDELALGVANAFLAPHCRKIQLMLTQIISIYPGETAQMLHRDRDAWGGYIPREIEPQLNTIWALTDFTKDNGATRIAPGSITWDNKRHAQPEELVQAEMSKGSVLFYSGSVIHSGGENRSDEARMGPNMDYCLDWLRQEENQYLSCPPELARTLPQAVTELIGYTDAGYALGYYTDPTAANQRDIRQAEEAIGYKSRKKGAIL